MRYLTKNDIIEKTLEYVRKNNTVVVQLAIFPRGQNCIIRYFYIENPEEIEQILIQQRQVATTHEEQEAWDNTLMGTIYTNVKKLHEGKPDLNIVKTLWETNWHKRMPLVGIKANNGYIQLQGRKPIGFLEDNRRHNVIALEVSTLLEDTIG